MRYQEIKDMPVCTITLPRENREFMDNWFRDIATRHAHSGNLFDMMMEAYVLGFDHCVRGQEHFASLESKGGQS